MTGASNVGCHHRCFTLVAPSISPDESQKCCDEFKQRISKCGLEATLSRVRDELQLSPAPINIDSPDIRYDWCQQCWLSSPLLHSFRGMDESIEMAKVRRSVQTKHFEMQQ